MKIITLNTWGKYGPYKKRWGFLLEELAQFKLDILCLQEVQDDMLTKKIKTCLGLPHAFPAYEAGLLILSRFPPFLEHTVKYESISKIEKEDRRAIVVGFNSGSNKVAIANTHLSWRPEDDLVRLGQTKQLLEDVGKTPYPTLLTGDFNDTPKSRSIMEIKKRGYQNLLELLHPKKLRITWDNRNPFIQAHNVRFPDREIDFLFASPEFLKLNPLKTCKIVLNRPNQNRIYPSDHYGVFAEFG